jgi:hypothetical protein
MLKCLLGGTVVATTRLALVPDQVNSAPLTLSTSDVVSQEVPSKRQCSSPAGAGPAGVVARRARTIMGKKYAAARINASRLLRRKKQSDAYLLTTRGGASVIRTESASGSGNSSLPAMLNRRDERAKPVSF